MERGPQVAHATHSSVIHSLIPGRHLRPTVTHLSAITIVPHTRGTSRTVRPRRLRIGSDSAHECLGFLGVQFALCRDHIGADAHAAQVAPGWNALASLSSLGWSADVAPRSGVPVLYLTIKRSVCVSVAMLLAFIFSEVASETLVELAALAAAATSAMPCVVGIAPEVGALPPPHAASATESATPTALGTIRRVNNFDQLARASLIVC
jgi:hypothetical protein